MLKNKIFNTSREKRQISTSETSRERDIHGQDKQRPQDTLEARKQQGHLKNKEDQLINALKL